MEVVRSKTAAEVEEEWAVLGTDAAKGKYIRVQFNLRMHTGDFLTKKDWPLWCCKDRVDLTTIGLNSIVVLYNSEACQSLGVI